MVLCRDINFSVATKNFSVVTGLGLGPSDRGHDKGFHVATGPFGQLGFCVL